MKKFLLLIFLASAMIGCKSTRTGSTQNLEVRFLHDYNLPEDLEVKGTAVGGLSGIDYHEETFYMVSDHPATARIYTAEFDISGERIDSIRITDVIILEKSHNSLKEQHLDLEGVLFQPKEETFLLSSEGNIKSNKDPMIFSVSKEGNFDRSFSVPENLLAESIRKPRNNGTFEGLAASYDGKGVWAAMELPLETDGPKPKLYPTKSPVRITYFDKNSGTATKQFPYRLERIAKIPWLYFAVNGVTDLLEYAPNKFLVIERGFVAGHGRKGNTVRIFDVDATLATNTLDINNLRVSFNNPAKKTLLYDFKWAKDYLSQEIIDNIEGITFGPVLSNGNQSLILISDNNFNSMGQQLNQVILMEFIPKK
ncbi:esterase-like activity of phytase family protein [Salinimicrobium xinjiangense]|uniref:esterase-like activity of phytase family protein n=1 Tax=Salinimicrobium xinjiangense TaxID=438596 RepID=UPI001FE056A0|nr:esterase-like activity of phytase family protein [Salinimicrobium xinjiangense]